MGISVSLFSTMLYMNIFSFLTTVLYMKKRREKQPCLSSYNSKHAVVVLEVNHVFADFKNSFRLRIIKIDRVIVRKTSTNTHAINQPELLKTNSFSWLQTRATACSKSRLCSFKLNSTPNQFQALLRWSESKTLAAPSSECADYLQ